MTHKDYCNRLIALKSFYEKIANNKYFVFDSDYLSKIGQNEEECVCVLDLTFACNTQEEADDFVSLHMGKPYLIAEFPDEVKEHYRDLCEKIDEYINEKDARKRRRMREKYFSLPMLNPIPIKEKA